MPPPRVGLSHAVYETRDVPAARAFYEATFGRRFRGKEVLRLECWFLARPDGDGLGWTVYFSTPDLDAALEHAQFQAVRVTEEHGTRFAHVDDPDLGRFTIQGVEGGDAAAHLLSSDPERALARIDAAFGIYAEKGSDVFATTPGACVGVEPGSGAPRWVPAWSTRGLEKLVDRAVAAGARVADVRPTWKTSVDLVDPWGHRFTAFDETAFDVDELPDLATAKQARAYFAGERDREARAADATRRRIERWRARWLSRTPHGTTET